MFLSTGTEVRERRLAGPDAPLLLFLENREVIPGLKIYNFASMFWICSWSLTSWSFFLTARIFENVFFRYFYFCAGLKRNNRFCSSYLNTNQFPTVLTVRTPLSSSLI